MVLLEMVLNGFIGPPKDTLYSALFVGPTNCHLTIFSFFFWEFNSKDADSDNHYFLENFLKDIRSYNHRFLLGVLQNSAERHS